MKRLLLIGLFAAHIGATAQVVLTPNVSQYNFEVLAGSQRQISVHMTGGTTNKINWSVLSTTGGASATLDRTTNAPGTTGVTIGSTPGACSISGALGHYVVSSTATVTIQAQSVDDATKTAAFLFNVCADTTEVQVLPAYQQAFKGQPRSLQSYVVGNTDESGTWSIVTQPSAGAGSLSDANKRDTIFTGTVTGRYTLQYTSAANPAKSKTAIVYVSPNAMPSYTSTRNLTQPTECYVDPALTGKDYEVGPGLPQTTITSVPLNVWAPGSIMRVHNTDTTGNNPTTFHESLRVMKGGTPTQPVILCGVPDSAGNLPIIDGANATTSSWNNAGTQSYGIVNIWGSGGYNVPYSAGSNGPDYLVLSGLSIAHAGIAYNYVPSDGTVPLLQWNSFASCIDIRSGQHLLIEGNDMNGCDNGMYVGNNAAPGFSQVTEFNYIRGNRARNASYPGAFGSHDMYVQSFWTVVEGNRFDSTVPLAHGDALKWRGTEGIFRYNFFNNGFGGDQLINEESATDAMPYVTFEVMLGKPGDTNCQSFYCAFEQAAGYSPDTLAAFQESLEKEWMYGNIFSGRGLQLSTIQYGDSGGSGTYQWYNQTEMSDHLGTLRFYNNTVDQPEYAVFQNAGIVGNTETDQQAYKPRELIANNIMYKSTQTPVSEFAFGQSAALIATFQTNLMNATTVDMTTPINGAPYTQVNTYKGWLNYTDNFQYPLALPIDGHIFGFSSANFLTTNCQPYNAATFVPVAGCGAIGAGSTLAEPGMALLPVRSQYSVEQSAVIPRVNPLTIGAVETGAQPTLTSMAFAPDVAKQLTYFKGYGYGTFVATIDCTFSDGIHQECGPQATMSYSDGSFQTLGGNKIIGMGGPPSTGTITATIGTIKASTPFSINQPATVAQLSVSSNYLNIPIRGKTSVTAKALNSDNSTPDVTSSATWATDNPQVAVVSNGVITGVGLGTALITASIQGGSYGAGQTQIQVITVNTVAATTTVSSLVVSPGSATLAPGASFTFTAIATNSDASTADIAFSPLTTWSSSNPAVASVVNGVVTGLGAGTAVITATSGSARGSATVTVTGKPVGTPPPPAPVASVVSVSITPGTAQPAVGTTAQLTATATMSDGTTSDMTTLATWTTSNQAVAAVANGSVTGVGSGTSVITATCGTVRATATITVPSATMTSIAVSPSNASTTIGSPVPLTAIATYSDKTTLDVTKLVTWLSSNPAVLAISASTANPLTVGSVTITASMGKITSPADAFSVAASHSAGALSGNAKYGGNVR